MATWKPDYFKAPLVVAEAELRDEGQLPESAGVAIRQASADSINWLRTSKADQRWVIADRAAYRIVVKRDPLLLWHCPGNVKGHAQWGDSVFASGLADVFDEALFGTATPLAAPFACCRTDPPIGC